MVQGTPLIAIRQAGVADIEVVSSILREASAWLEDRGMAMWYPEELEPGQISAHVRDGLFFLAEQAGQPIGTVRFQLVDPLFWPDVPQDEAAYVHRLAVRRHAAGGSGSAALLSWAARRARSLDLTYLRLDCDASRVRLRELYERFGFRHHSDRQVGPHYVARYQLDVAVASEAPTITVRQE